MREIADHRRSNRGMIGSAGHARYFCYASGVHAPEDLPCLAEHTALAALTCASGMATAPRHPLPRIAGRCGWNDLEQI